MSKITQIITELAATHAQVGTAELSRRSGVPYTTIAGLAEKGFRPKSVEVLVNLARAVDEINSVISEPSHSERSKNTIIGPTVYGRPVGEVITRAVAVKGGAHG
ncbi:hypothetical protein Q1W73_16595 [Asticcacaulis sp. ZE23SCel15]|uniref:hypothetical protein n=1 Tax=Asticcacaulis sp. ZE23SCel15 TaxID=3059027 RepID=UPI00265D9F07|nr:hypothetical protein [Asticcacaulis sp. ZE23SCel15]WKL57263.1 hypothetical protein Q1W73_16595 [Asticcacaulis sp. ZE23SCel15]